MGAIRRVRKVTVWVLTAAVVLLAATVRPSSAEPITIRFTLFPDPQDPVNLAPSNGSFTFDSSLVPAGGGLIIDDNGQLASRIAFNWGITSWTEASAGVIAMQFNAAGQLLHFRMGGAPNGLLAMVHTPIDDFWLVSPLMEYTLQGHPRDGFFLARVTSPDMAPIPEPGTLLLAGGGVLYLLRRRARSSVAA